MYAQKRKYSTGSSRQPPLKRQRTYAPRYRGLVPTYRGFNPRAFTRGEWKFHDTTVSTTVDTTGSMTLCNGIAPGNSASQRIGMNVAIRSIEMRLNCRSTTGTGVDQGQRYLLLLDRQCNGAAPAALTDFLTVGNYQGLRNLGNRKRFKVLKDFYFNLNAAGEPGSARTIYKYMKFRRPLKVEFNSGVAGTVADIASNSLYFIAIGNIVAGATAGTCVGYIRIRYTDM